MFGNFQLAFKYFRYLTFASNGKGHGIHSPFVFDFVVNVLNARKYSTPAFKKIEKVRRELKSSKDIVEVIDLGAGSRKNNQLNRKISSIARSAAKPPKYAQLIYRILCHYKIDSALEMGTSLGLTTRYMSLAKPSNGVYTIEGAPFLALYTKQMLKKEGYEETDITLIAGGFHEELDKVLPKMKGSKLVFIDGDHKYNSTIEYFNKIISSIGDKDIVVFDDIHWSEGMEEAWKEIQKYEQVTCTIDLFFVGIVFFRKEFKESMHFTIRF